MINVIVVIEKDNEIFNEKDIKTTIIMKVWKQLL